MGKQRVQTRATKSWVDPEAVETNRDRDVVRMAKMILADFTQVSGQTAHALLRLAANRRK